MDNPIKDMDERIIVDRDGVVIFNKPHDIPTSGRSLDDDDAVQFWLMKKYDTMVWAVHQLDADTSGVNLFVTKKKLVGKFQKALADPRATKRYVAVVHGEPEQECFECNEPIGYVSERSLGVTSTGKSAKSHFEVIERSGGYSLVEARIYTGRTHQIRIHLAHLGFHLVGEEWYGESPCVEHPRQALHAYETVLAEPSCRFTAPLAEDLKDLCVRLNLTRWGDYVS